MDTKTLRLELLKLTYAHGREAPQAVERARVLEKYVLEGDPAPKRGPGRPKKAEKPE